MPLCIAFINLTKAFNVSRNGLFRALEKIGCPPKLHSLTESFHSNMKGIVQYNGNLSETFDIHIPGSTKVVCLPQPLGFSSLSS